MRETFPGLALRERVAPPRRGRPYESGRRAGTPALLGGRAIGFVRIRRKPGNLETC